MIDQARREPVLVQSHGRDSVVILDHAEYARLRNYEAAVQAAPATRPNNGTGFLRSLAGLFDSGDTDPSEQVRAIVDEVLLQKFR